MCVSLNHQKQTKSDLNELNELYESNVQSAMKHSNDDACLNEENEKSDANFLCVVNVACVVKSLSGVK